MKDLFSTKPSMNFAAKAHRFESQVTNERNFCQNLHQHINIEELLAKYTVPGVTLTGTTFYKSLSKFAAELPQKTHVLIETLVLDFATQHPPTKFQPSTTHPH